MGILNRKYIFKWWIFHCYVRLLEIYEISESFADVVTFANVCLLQLHLETLILESREILFHYSLQPKIHPQSISFTLQHLTHLLNLRKSAWYPNPWWHAWLFSGERPPGTRTWGYLFGNGPEPGPVLAALLGFTFGVGVLLVGGWVSTHNRKICWSKWIHLPQVLGVNIRKISKKPSPRWFEEENKTSLTRSFWWTFWTNGTTKSPCPSSSRPRPFVEWPQFQEVHVIIFHQPG